MIVKLFGNSTEFLLHLQNGSGENALYAREDKILHSILSMQSSTDFFQQARERIQAQGLESHQFLKPGF